MEKLKAIIISDTDQRSFERKITETINGESVWHNDFNELVSINYSFNREHGFVESMIYSALIVYK
ncbi:MAG: hypothetical protein ACI4PE_02630 [Bacilli bacterium]